MIDLRSDTFTLPTPEMLTAMVTAPLGDDGYREDPTVIRLEMLAANRLGKEAACLMPSGTMANLASMLAHCHEEPAMVLLGDQSDMHVYEDCSVARGLGVTYRPLRTDSDGTISPSAIESQLNTPAARVLCLENPHNLCGGMVLPAGYIDAMAEIAHAHGVALHVDGARIFNAAVAMGIKPAEIVRHADSVQFCLSKGLSAPIGSIVVGSSDFIEQVRSKRKMLGGSMRQAGIVAAAGIVALEHMVERLAEDHANARLLARGLAALPAIQVHPDRVQTNTVVFRVLDDRFSRETFIAAARQQGLGVSEFEHGRMRAVTHYGITANDIEEAVFIVARVLEQGADPARPAEKHRMHA